MFGLQFAKQITNYNAGIVFVMSKLSVSNKFFAKSDER